MRRESLLGLLIAALLYLGRGRSRRTIRGRTQTLCGGLGYLCGSELKIRPNVGHLDLDAVALVAGERCPRVGLLLPLAATGKNPTFTASGARPKPGSVKRRVAKRSASRSLPE